MFPWNPFQERVFSLRKCILCRPSRGHISRTVSELVAKKEGKGNSLQSKKKSVEFGSYQGCRGFRIELRVGVEESSGKRLSGSGDSAVRVQRDSVVIGCKMQ
jgi:hypothetical protein